LNFLAHLVLAGEEENLQLGAMLGDFVRGKAELEAFDPGTRVGIMLHRRIDASTDSLPEVSALLEYLQPPFRRFGGIIIDLMFDHELALRWREFSSLTLQEFDQDVRDMLARHESILPDRLKGFMRYADRRGLFAAYREPAEILHSLRGVGRRLSRENPLHRVEEIWDQFEPLVAAAFEPVFQAVQSDVSLWVNEKSMMTGS